MKMIYCLLCVLASVYFISISILFNSGKLTAAEFVSLVGVIPLSTIALFQEQFKQWWFAPTLRMDFELEEPYCSKTPFYIGWKDASHIDHKVATEAYYFRFAVTNLGRSQAKLCEVFISELKEYKASKWQDVAYFQQVNLRWDTGKSRDAYMNINPCRQIRILSNIGHIVKESEGVDKSFAAAFHLDYLYSIGGYQPQYLNVNTKYRFKITVVSENAEVKSKAFELFWTGVWKDSHSEMFKEVMLKEI